MRSIPLTLRVVRPNWGAAATAVRTATKPDDARAAIFTRDDYTCQCCGFKAQKYQDIVHMNGDERDWSDDNVATVCVFCYQCFDLTTTGQQRSAMLVYLPEMTQANLHHVMRALYVARVTQTGLGDAARDAYERFMKRGDEAKKRLGSNDPEALGLVMRDFLTQKQYADFQERLNGIRLLPLDRRMVRENELEYNQFPQILAYWRSKNGPFGGLPAAEWASRFKDMAA
jgi:intracellular multiplication protein IcmJ